MQQMGAIPLEIDGILAMEKFEDRPMSPERLKRASESETVTPPWKGELTSSVFSGIFVR